MKSAEVDLGSMEITVDPIPEPPRNPVDNPFAGAVEVVTEAAAELVDGEGMQTTRMLRTWRGQR